MSLLEMSIRQHANITKSKYSKICTILQLSLCWEIQRENNTGRPFESRLHIDYYTKIIFLSFAQQAISIVATWLFSHDENHLDPELWEHSGAIRVSERRITRNVRPRERRQSHDCSWRLWCPSIWTSLGATKQISLNRSNRSVLTLPYSWDYSWVPFRNYRGRSSEKLKTREDEIEEVKKQKTLKIRDEDWNSAKWKQTWTWTTVSSSSSSTWREWSSDQTRERSEWQSADLDSSDQAREATTGQSHYTWHWGHLHRSSQGHPWRRK